MSPTDLDSVKKPEKATFSSPEVSGSAYELEVHFNPATMKLTRKRKWEDGKQFNAIYPGLQWVGTEHDTLGFDLFFDHTEPRELSDMAAVAASLNPVMNLGPMAKMLGLVNEDTVEDQLKVLYALTTPYILFDDEPDGKRPPLATFTWNKFAFTGAITNLVVDYKVFAEDGTPKRAKVTIEMKGRLNWNGPIKVTKGQGLPPKMPETS